MDRDKSGGIAVGGGEGVGWRTRSRSDMEMLREVWRQHGGEMKRRFD